MVAISPVNNNLHTNGFPHTKKENILANWKQLAYASVVALGAAVGMSNSSVAKAANYGPEYRDTYNADGTFNFDAQEHNIREAYRNGIGRGVLSATDRYFQDMAELNALRAKNKSKSVSFEEAMKIPAPNKNAYYPKVTPFEMKRIVIGILDPKEEKYTRGGVEGYIAEVKSKITGYTSTQTEGALDTQYRAFIKTVLQLKELAKEANDEQWNAYSMSLKPPSNVRLKPYPMAYYEAVDKYNKAAKKLVEKNMGMQIPGDFYNVPVRYRKK